MTSITARAHSATTSTDRSRVRSPPADAAVAAFAFERALQVDAPRLERRHHAEEQAGADRDDQRDRQHAQIDGRVGDARDVGRRERDEQHAHRRPRGRRRAPPRPSPAAGPSTANWRISRSPLAPSAVRTATSRRRALPRASSRLATFAHATSRTRPDGGQQHEQRRPDRTEDDGRQAARRRRRARAFSGYGALEIGGDRGELLLRLPRTLPRMRATMKIGCVERGIDCGVCWKRQPDVDRRARAAIRERARVVGRRQNLKHAEVRAALHDADDRERPIVEPDRAADDRRIAAERARPESVADHADGRTARPRLLGGEPAAGERTHAEHRQQLVGHRRAPAAGSPRRPRACSSLRCRQRRRSARRRWLRCL